MSLASELLVKDTKPVTGTGEHVLGPRWADTSGIVREDSSMNQGTG